MKQMISNWKEIESLEDFLYYDKESGKIKIKKEIDLAVPLPSFDPIENTHSLYCESAPYEMEILYVNNGSYGIEFISEGNSATYDKVIAIAIASEYGNYTLISEGDKQTKALLVKGITSPETGLNLIASSEYPEVIIPLENITDISV